METSIRPRLVVVFPPWPMRGRACHGVEDRGDSGSGAARHTHGFVPVTKKLSTVKSYTWPP